MKAESLQMPSKPYEINIIGSEAEITLLENVREEEETEETPRKWTWDEYRLRVKPRQNLADCVENNYTVWLAAKAKVYEDTANAVRTRRNELIAATDYLMTKDYPISEADLLLVAEYRQALRDIPEQNGFPFDVMFPIKLKN